MLLPDGTAPGDAQAILGALWRWGSEGRREFRQFLGRWLDDCLLSGPDAELRARLIEQLARQGWRVREADSMLVNCDPIRGVPVSAPFLRASRLHPLVEAEARPQFLISKPEQGVFASMKAVEIRVRKLAGFGEDVIGVDLMNKAFGPTGPLTNRSAAKGEQEGTRMLFAGAYAVLRNPAGHRQVDYADLSEAAEAVQTASLLMRILDRVEDGMLAAGRTARAPGSVRRPAVMRLRKRPPAEVRALARISRIRHWQRLARRRRVRLRLSRMWVAARDRATQLRHDGGILAGLVRDVLFATAGNGGARRGRRGDRHSGRAQAALGACSSSRPTPDDYGALVGAAVGAEAALLALFFATVGVIASTAYARVPGEIRQLFVRERTSLIYVWNVAVALLVGLVVLTMPLVAHRWPHGLTVLLFAVLTAFSVLSLAVLGTRLFNFFDLSTLVAPAASPVSARGKGCLRGRPVGPARGPAASRA